MSDYIAQQPAGRSRGFSLLELMIALSVLALLLVIALPNFRESNTRNKVTTTTNDLIGAIQLARSEAAKRGVPVAVMSNSAGPTWATGWYVQSSSLDAAVPPNIVFTGGVTYLVRKYAALDTNYSVTTKSTPAVPVCTGACSSDSQIVFDASGRQLGGNFDINVCRPDHSKTLENHIQILGSGATNSFRDTTSSLAPAC